MKRGDRNRDDFFCKVYSFDGYAGDVMESIIRSGIQFKSVDLTDSGDVGLKYFGGEYSWQEFCKMYNLVKGDIETATFLFAERDGSIAIACDSNYLTLVTRERNLEIQDLIRMD